MMNYIQHHDLPGGPVPLRRDIVGRVGIHRNDDREGARLGNSKQTARLHGDNRRGVFDLNVPKSG